MSTRAAFRGGGESKSEYKDKDKPTQIRYSNITAAKGNNTVNYWKYWPITQSSTELVQVKPVSSHGKAVHKNVHMIHVFFACVFYAETMGFHGKQMPNGYNLQEIPQDLTSFHMFVFSLSPSLFLNEFNESPSLFSLTFFSLF